jgi:hypothetical protein
MIVELERPHETELCAWGCGQPAKFFLDGVYKTSKKEPRWTCSRRWQLCPARLKRGRERYTATMLARHGVAVPTKDPACDLKRRQTNLERYGAEQVMQSSKVQRKYRRTLRSRYGATHISQVPGVLEKANATRVENETLGGDLEKRKTTSQAKYGTDWPIQDPDVFQRNVDSCFKHKAFVLPSGAIVFLQGYEPHVVSHMLANGYREQDFLWRGKPSFWYTDKAGRRRRYHPDLVLPARRLIVEVKARKWFERDLDLIVRKGRACQEAGWEFMAAVMGNHIRKRGDNPVEFVPYRLLKQEA